MADARRLRELIDQTHKRGVDIGRKIKELVRQNKALEVLNAQRRRELRAKEAPHSFSMFDAIEVSQIPANAQAVAGYIGGKWPTYGELIKRFPKAKHLSIAVFASLDAACLDIETGDASPGQAPAWVKRQKARGVKRPCLYANLSTMPAVKGALTKAGIKREDVRLWVAEWTFVPHIPPGYDACQWTDRALGRNLDQSLCTGNFLD